MRADCTTDPAPHLPGLPCRSRAPPAGRRARTQALPAPAGRRAPSEGRSRFRSGLSLCLLVLVADHRLQGAAPAPADRSLLPRSARPGVRERARDRAPAIQHQYLSELGTRPPLSAPRSQRGDQHPARQCECVPGPREPLRFAGVRSGSGEAPAGRGRRGQRLRNARQCARAAAAQRTLSSPRTGDDDSAGLGGRPRHGARASRLLRVPRVAHGAVGRARARRLQRRGAGGSVPRPQRASARPAHGHDRRPGHRRFRGRRGGCAAGADSQARAPGSGRNGGPRHPAAAPARGPGAQDGPCRRPSLPRMARCEPRGRR